VTAYATWDFGGRAGADALAGLVYIDGGRLRSVTAQKARAELQALDMANSSPWESIGGIPAPLAGLFTAVSSTAVVLDPDGPSPFQSSGLLPADLTPPVAATNLAQFGFPLNVKTSPSSLALAQAHLGQGLAAAGNPRGWNSAGALTPITRFAQMFSGSGIQNADGSEWYFPLRLSLDTRAIDNGNANPAQTVFGEHATEGHRLPRTLLIYAFGAHLQGQAVLQAVSALAKQSRIPASNLTLVNRQSTYAHNDPAGAYPTNAFFAHLVPFLDRIAGHQL
jgi:hypothetical protein